MGLIIPFFIQHQGCPHRCLFCNQHSIAGTAQVGANGADPTHELGDTIEQWLSRARPRTNVQVAFFGGSFTCLDEALQYKLLQGVAPFISRGQVDSIRLSTRPDCLSDEICGFLIANGVATLEIGAQSMNDYVLDRARRGHTAADTAWALSLLKKHGLESGLQLMVGLPGETTRAFLDGVDAVAALAPDFVRLYPALVLENTELAELYRNSSWRPLSLARAVVLTGRARERLLGQGIEVIRMGLQDSAELAKQVLGGPYHPAFGELVLTRSWYLRIGRLLKRAGLGKTLKLTVSERDYSALAGVNKTNLKRLKNLSRGAALEVQTEGFLKRNTFYYAVH